MTGRLAVPPAGIPRPPRRAQYSSTCDERPFAVWLMFGVIGIPIRRGPDLNALEFGLLTSTPMLTGALFRLPLGIWTDRFGGRISMFLLLICCALPVWLSSYADQLWQFLLLGWRSVLSAPLLPWAHRMSPASFRRNGNNGRRDYQRRTKVPAMIVRTKANTFIPWTSFSARSIDD